MAGVNDNTSLITLYVNDLNTLMKRQRLAQQMKSYDLTLWCLQGTCIKIKDTTSLKNVKNYTLQILTKREMKL